MRRKSVVIPILVRLPIAMKIWLEMEAAQNGSSQNSEIVRTIRARMDSEKVSG
jgi:hypothetical protein